MTAPLITQADPEKVLTDYLAILLPTLAQTVGWSYGTLVQASVTPNNAVRVRLVGGIHEQRVADRPRIDVRVWKDGTYNTEATAKQVARILIAHMRRDLGATVALDPIPLPDPADPTRTHVLFTIELLLRGVQS